MVQADALLEKARTAAQNRGHRLGLFNHVDQRTYIAECQRCGGTLMVTPNPSPEESEIMGTLVATDCPAT